MEKAKLKGMVFAALFAALTGAVAWFKIPLPFTPVPITLQTLMVLLSGAVLGAYYGGLSMIVYLILGAIGLPVFAGGSSGIPALLGPTGGYLLSYPVAAFVVGKMIEKKKLNAFVRYFSFGAVVTLAAVVLADSIYGMGIMKLWDDASKSYVPMVGLLSQNQRMVLIAFSVAVLAVLLFLVIRLKKTKSFSTDTILAMFAGTLVIYLMGSVHGKLATGLPWSAIFVGWVLPFIIGDILKLLLAAWIAKNIGIKSYMK